MVLLEDVYCSITVAKHRLIRIIRFVSQIRGRGRDICFVIKLIKVLLNSKILFDVMDIIFRGQETNRA